MLYFSKIQDDSHRIIAPISCIMPSFHKLNLIDIIGCVLSMFSQTITVYVITILLLSFLYLIVQVVTL